MDTRRTAPGNRKHQRLVNRKLARALLAVFWLAAGWTALGAATSPKPSNPIVVELSPGPILAGSRFELTIKVPDTGISVPEAKLTGLPNQVTLLGGPEIIRDNDLDDSGRRTRYIGLRYQLRANAPGYLEFPAIAIQNGSQQFQSDPLLLGIVAEADPKHVPPSLVWNIRAQRLFEGQAIYLSLDLRFSETINFPDKVELGPWQGGIVQEVNGLGRIEMEQVLGREFPRIPVASYIFTPSSRSTGINLPSARISYGSKVYSCAAQHITIDPLPSEDGASGAIGDFRYSAFLNKNQVSGDEQFLLTIRVEGEGNLNFLRMPEPAVGALKILGKADNSRYIPSELGYRGFRETVYRLSGSQIGPSAIEVPGFAWIDSQAKFSASPAVSLSYTVSTQLSGQKETDSAQVAHPFIVDEIRSLQPRNFYASIAGWLFYLPGLLLMVLALAIGRSRRMLWIVLAVALIGGGLALAFLPGSPSGVPDTGWPKSIQAGTQNYEVGDFQAAYQDYSRALGQFKDSPAIMYNLAIACFGKNAQAQGMYYLQKAARILPDNQRLIATLTHYERQLKLDRQLPIINLPKADLVFLVGALTLAMAGLFLVISRRLRLMGLIGFSIFALLSLADLAGLVFAIGQMQAPVAIISETGGAVRKIPDDRAGEWLTLRGGTSVLLLANTGKFWLAETAYGVKGWLDISALYTSDDLGQISDTGPQP